jgi:benzoylformate decarboxylase
MTPLTLMAALARVLPEDVALIEEAVTTTNTYLERLGAVRNATGYFGHRGWALGWGLGCAIGAKLAWPGRPVVALLGDGAAMYGIQGLWTAARERIPVTFVICNNAQYQILKVGAQGMGLPHARQGEFVGLDIVGPEIDYVVLARSLGVPAVRLTEPDAVADAVAESFTTGEPRLIDVPIGRELPDRLNYA